MKLDKIDSLDVFMVDLPLVTAFETSFDVETKKEALLLRVMSSGIEGWGECVSAPNPYYSPETNRTAFHIIKDFISQILRESNNFTLQEIVSQFGRIRGHQMAKAAVENCLMDLFAKHNGMPLYQFIGGEKCSIRSGISIGIQSKIEGLMDIIDEALAKKYHRIKVKIKRGKDNQILEAIRARYPDIPLMADANSDYTLNEMDLLKELDKYRLIMIEQPLAHDDIYFHSLLQAQLHTPICLDESIKTVDHAKTALALNSCRVINIKQGRVGGLLNAIKIAEICGKQNIPVWSGGMLETGIGRAFNLHLQTLPHFTLPGDTSETSRYFREDIVDQPVILDAEGYISLPSGNGIGVSVLSEKLKKYTIFQEKIF